VLLVAEANPFANAGAAALNILLSFIVPPATVAASALGLPGGLASMWRVDLRLTRSQDSLPYLPINTHKESFSLSAKETAIHHHLITSHGADEDQGGEGEIAQREQEREREKRGAEPPCV
jgi:hypothetical protein